MQSCSKSESSASNSAATTVTIGNQVWMKKNLDVDRYRNGDLIPQVTDPTEWSNLTTGAWCYYNNNPANGATYGKLYNWYAVNDPRGLAPTGYHIPSDSEWTILTNYLGGINTAGSKMKETGTVHWTSPNTCATNSSGFTGLPAGYRTQKSTLVFSDLGGTAYWWSSSEGITSFSGNIRFLTTSCEVFNNDEFKTDGLSIRCVKD